MTYCCCKFLGWGVGPGLPWALCEMRCHAAAVPEKRCPHNNPKVGHATVRQRIMREWRGAARRGTFLEQCGTQVEAGVVQRQKLACWLRWRAKYGLILRHRQLLGQAAQQLRQRGLAAAFR